MEGYRAQLIARAVENNIWVIQSNGIGPLSPVSAVSLGQSRIVDPGGCVIDEAPALRDAMLVAEIEPAKASRDNAQETFRQPRLGAWWKSAFEMMTPPVALSCTPSKTTARLALMQADPEKWNLKTNFAVFLRCLEDADAQDADIFITPECWLDGYAASHKDSTPERLRAVAQDLNESPFLRQVAEEAKKRGMYICFGFTSLENGKPYNAAGLWSERGERVGVYHKTHLQTHDLQFAPGESLPVFPSPWGPLGIMICADRRWPETARTLRLKGAKLILNPTYGMHHLANEWWMRTRGYENQCYIAFTHPQVGFVVGPKGDIEGKRELGEPGVLICDIDLTRAKDDNHIRDRRPDLYTILTAPN